MASTAPTEQTPLIPCPDPQPSVPTSSNPSSSVAPKPPRTVTFDPHTTVSSVVGSASAPLRPPFPSAATTGPAPSSQAQPGALSTLNSKLRRRNSHGAPTGPPIVSASKIGPQRTTKTAQKLKLLPNPDPGDDGPDEESGRDVYSQFTRIKDPTARRDAARLGKADRDKLPRVTAYCTANAYRLDGLMKFLKGRARTRGAAPKLFDECIYTPYNYPKPSGKNVDHPIRSRAPPTHERRYSDSAVEVEDNNKNRREDLVDLHGDDGETTMTNGESSMPMDDAPYPMEQRESTPDFDTKVHTPEVFLFNYGTVVIWGMTVVQEQRFLKEIARFETEKLARDDVQTENFNFYYTREYQARIYNDFISLREKKNYMTKLAISHALSQSVKVCLWRVEHWSAMLTSPPDVIV